MFGCVCKTVCFDDSYYVKAVVSPKSILSDNGTQFTSPTWKKQLTELAIEVRFCPVRRPQANPSERFMKEIRNFLKIVSKTIGSGLSCYPK
jgi:transposase InsO family protein